MSIKFLADTDTIDLPVNDHRQYRLIELPNGLTTLLISDPSIGGESKDDDTPPPPPPTGGCWPSFRRAAIEEEEDDSGAKTAACALSVGVGYHNDPSHLGGLAHFLEHMLFMGTATYPKENGWNAFLSKHGGSDNGETDAASTVFYFDVKHDHLKPALDRFGSFFSCPLLKWSGSKRE